MSLLPLVHDPCMILVSSSCDLRFILVWSSYDFSVILVRSSLHPCVIHGFSCDSWFLWVILVLSSDLSLMIVWSTIWFERSSLSSHLDKLWSLLSLSRRGICMHLFTRNLRITFFILSFFLSLFSSFLSLQFWGDKLQIGKSSNDKVTSKQITDIEIEKHTYGKETETQTDRQTDRRTDWRTGRIVMNSFSEKDNELFLIAKFIRYVFYATQRWERKKSQ